jgi:hypothetical protein
MKHLLGCVFISLLIISLSGIQVSGTMTQDTIWAPADNPINVTDNLIINEGVTLTILPCSQIYFNSRRILNLEEFSPGYYYDGGANLGKMIWCHGNLIVEGTEEEPILFTRLQDEYKYFWGNIYLDLE